MRIRTDTAASAASLADYLRRCECLVEVIDGRIINATARPQSLAAPHQDVEPREARRRPAPAQPAPQERVRPAMRAVPNPSTTAPVRVPTSSRGRHHQRAPRHEGAAANGGERQHADQIPRARANHVRSRRHLAAPVCDETRGVIARSPPSLPRGCYGRLLCFPRTASGCLTSTNLARRTRGGSAAWASLRPGLGAVRRGSD